MTKKTLLDLPEEEKKHRLKLLGMTEEEYRAEIQEDSQTLDAIERANIQYSDEADVPEKFKDTPVIDWQDP